MPQLNLGILLENLQITHSYLRNFIKDIELWPPSPSSTSGRNQQEVNIQEQDRNRHYFCLPKTRCMRVGETVNSSRLASRVLSFFFPSEFSILPTPVDHARPKIIIIYYYTYNKYTCICNYTQKTRR